eukprot:709157-Rhodomonas_salina.1
MPSQTPSAVPVTSDVTQHLASALSSPTSSSGAISHALIAPRHLRRHPAPRRKAVLVDVRLSLFALGPLGRLGPARGPQWGGSDSLARPKHDAVIKLQQLRGVFAPFKNCPRNRTKTSKSGPSLLDSDLKTNFCTAGINFRYTLLQVIGRAALNKLFQTHLQLTSFVLYLLRDQDALRPSGMPTSHCNEESTVRWQDPASCFPQPVSILILSHLLRLQSCPFHILPAFSSPASGCIANKKSSHFLSMPICTRLLDLTGVPTR